jgi:hypothetical protein
LEAAKTMDMQTIKNTYPKESITRRQVIERVMVEAQGKTAKRWNGELRKTTYDFGEQPEQGKAGGEITKHRPIIR